MGVGDLCMGHESIKFQGLQKANFKNLIWLLKGRTVSVETSLQLGTGEGRQHREVNFQKGQFCK